MVNEFDILGDVYHYLKDSELAKVVTGQVSKTGRKTDKEDICISVLSDVPISQLQEAFVNVNIYVADLPDGKGAYIEDTIRLKKICALALQTLKVGSGEGFRISLSTQKTFKVEGANEHFINNKILYQFCND